MGPGFESLTSHQYNQGLTSNRRPFLLPIKQLNVRLYRFEAGHSRQETDHKKSRADQRKTQI
jgi:hypothetical protein